MISNLLKDENVKLKTKVHILESEITRKEKLVDDLLLQADTNAYGVNIANVQQSGPKLKLESHLTTNLKKKIRELQQNANSKQNEVDALKRHIKSTKVAEIEVEMKLYIDECARMRH